MNPPFDPSLKGKNFGMGEGGHMGGRARVQWSNKQNYEWIGTKGLFYPIFVQTLAEYALFVTIIDI